MKLGLSAKTLVVYYSYTNKCHEIVTTLTDQLQADVMRIEPAEKGLKYEANNYGLGGRKGQCSQNQWQESDCHDASSADTSLHRC